MLKGIFLLVGALFITTLFGLQNASAGSVSKIYINGEWKEIPKKETSLALPKASFTNFGLNTNLNNQALRSAKEFIQDAKDLFGGAFTQESTTLGEIFSTFRFKRTWNGIPILGGEVLVQSSNLDGGSIDLASGNALDLSSLPSVPNLSASQAESIALSSYRGNATATKAAQLKVIASNDGSVQLAYEVTVLDRDGFSSDIHYVDALRGSELFVTTNVHTLDRKILVGNGNESDFDFPEASWSLAFADQGCSGFNNTNPRPPKKKRWWDFSEESSAGIDARRRFNPEVPKICSSGVGERERTSAEAAWKNTAAVHEYYSTNFNRDSYDGQGSLMKSVVNFGGEVAFSNAAWYNDKKIMMYGVGDDRELNDFASPLDVVAHELTHAVTASTADLQYVSESGALNESYSDVFGKLVAFKYGTGEKDWKMGRELFKDGKRFIRDMENPEVAHVKAFKYKGQQCNRSNDFCGVHTNSGIPNKVAVLITKEIGEEKISKLYYMVLTQMLKTNSNFREAKAQTMEACKRLFRGISSRECSAVASAYNEVGIK